MTLACRRAAASDTAAILEVHRAAFSSHLESDLVAALLTHRSAHPAESWVAQVDGVVVGHVLLTPGRVKGDPALTVMLLCPLAVLPSHQHTRVGTALTRTAIDAARDAGVRAITVFGDPQYYSRFGFESLLPGGPLPAFDVAESQRDAWQTLLLGDGADLTRASLDGKRIVWADPLMTPSLWEG